MSLLTLRKRNQITLPGECIPEGVTQFECKVNGNGTILLTPLVHIPASQRYFWTKRWQDAEREVEEHVRAGRVKISKNAKELIKELDRIRE